MKKLFIVLFVLSAFTAKSQVIDTAFKSFGSITACKIQPFKAKFTDTVNVDHVGVRIVNDNLKTAANLYFALLDSAGLIHFEGYATVQGEDYQNWGGDNIYPFTFIGRLYNLVFIKSE